LTRTTWGLAAGSPKTETGEGETNDNESREPARQDRATGDLGAWYWLGAHGGSGVTTLAAAAGGGVDASTLRSRPQCAGPLAVVVVARTSAHGLVRAQEIAARAAEEGMSVLGVAATVMGLALVADAPGRLPKPLAELRHLVSGAYPNVWDVPWVEAWRQGDPPSARNTPKEVGAMAEAVRSLTSGSIVDLRTGLHLAGTHQNNDKEEQL
jgi:hypothetical protein